MTTSPVAWETTLAPKKPRISADAPTGANRLPMGDELLRQLRMGPANCIVSQEFRIYPSTGDLATMVAASPYRQSQPPRDLITRQSKPRPRFFTHVFTDSHSLDTRFFELINKDDTNSPASPASQADNQLPECLAALAEYYGAIEVPVVWEFAAGVDGVMPDINIVAEAGRLVKAANKWTPIPDIAVDVDGALSFYLRLWNGLLLMAELRVNGILDASVYNDVTKEQINHFPRATEAQFSDLLR